MDIKEEDTIRDILFQIKEDDNLVVIILKSGRDYNGKIESIGINNVVINQVGERSHFDAIIKLEEIAAIEYQVRS